MDRRQRYEDAMKKRGFVKRTHWCPADVCKDVADILRYFKENDAAELPSRVRLLLKEAADAARGGPDA